MPIDVTCGSCNKRMRVADTFAGKAVRCPGCKSPLSVPAPGDADVVDVEVIEEKFVHGCPSCGVQLKLAERFRGKRIKCPKCQQAIDVPAAAPPGSTPTAPAAAAPPPRRANPPEESEQWYVHAHDGQQYGPVSEAELDQWVEEGLITATCQVSNDNQTWQAASEFYPELDDDESFFPEGYQPILRLRSEGTSMISKAIVSDLKNSPSGNQITRAQYFQVGESR